MYQGFAVEPKKGDWGLFRAHLQDNVCSGDKALYLWLMAWLGNMFQYPADRPGTALILRGEQGAGSREQGAGKSIVGTIIGELWGPHFTHVSSPDSFLSKFNKHLQTCLFLLADEAVWAGDKKIEGRLKALVTEKMILVEPKGVDPYMARTLALLPNCQQWSTSLVLGQAIATLHVDTCTKGKGVYPGVNSLFSQHSHFVCSQSNRQPDPRPSDRSSLLIRQRSIG